MHNLNLGKTRRINLLMCTNPWGAILSSGLVRMYMFITHILYTKYEIQVLTARCCSSGCHCQMHDKGHDIG